MGIVPLFKKVVQNLLVQPLRKVDLAPPIYFSKSRAKHLAPPIYFSKSRAKHLAPPIYFSKSRAKHFGSTFFKGGKGGINKIDIINQHKD
jgi:hypothetical protein